MAALLRRGVINSFCGGVLITDRHVLTAAHCTYKYTRNEITVRLGEYNFGAGNETRSRDFRLADIRQHVDFDETTYDNDIAILKLQPAALFNSYIWPVCMPPTGDTFENYNGIVTGWGTQLRFVILSRYFFYQRIYLMESNLFFHEKLSFSCYIKQKYFFFEDFSADQHQMF